MVIRFKFYHIDNWDSAGATVYVDNKVVKNLKKVGENSTHICDTFESRIPDYINEVDLSVYH